MGMVYGYISKRSRNKAKKPTAFKPMRPAAPVAHRVGADDYKAAPSVGSGVGVATKSRAATYEDPVMELREAQAKRVQHTVAPICNKGGYQVITNEADLKTVGRKV